MVNVLIDADLRAQIPPLTQEEYSDLERSLIDEGCRDSLVVWAEKGIIVDGHNRYDICTRHNIPFNTFEKSFSDREAVIDWIDANQLARRNLNPEQMSFLRGRRYNRQKKTMAEAGAMKGKSSGQNVRSSTAESIAEQYGVDERTIRRDGQFADAVEKIEPYVPDITQKVMAGEVTKKAVIEAAKVPEKAHVSFNSGNNEWYTPAVYIEAAREVMGSIDLDPASSEQANKIVKASKYFTIEHDGLKETWAGNVWLNPPYAQPLISEFCALLVDKLKKNEIDQACVLVNNATETNFHQNIMSECQAVCFIKGRIKFIDTNGNSTGSPLQGQTILYFGDNRERFIAIFSRFGVVLIGE